MKTDLRSSAIHNTPSGPLLQIASRPVMEFGAGFRQFLASFPEEDEPTSTALPIQQPLRYLEAVPAMDHCPVLASSPSSVTSVQDSLSRSFGAAIFLAARPTTRALSLASAVNTVRSA